jgi:RNA polymerase sigma-70 factor (ECF subfamily)
VITACHKPFRAEDERRPARREAEHDAELVRRFKAGDEAAFVEIVVRHRSRAYGLAYSLLHDRGDAEEVAQDTFIRAHRALAQFRGESSLGTWLHHIAINLARNRYWHFFRRRRHATLSLDEPLGGADDGSPTLLDRLDSATPTPADETSEVEFAAAVDACLRELDPSQRDVLILRIVLNRSYRQIARLLRTELGTVKSRIARARQSLRLRMSERFPEFGVPQRPAWGPERPGPCKRWRSLPRRDAGLRASLRSNPRGTA